MWTCWWWTGSTAPPSPTTWWWKTTRRFLCRSRSSSANCRWEKGQRWISTVHLLFFSAWRKWNAASISNTTVAFYSYKCYLRYIGNCPLWRQNLACCKGIAFKSYQSCPQTLFSETRVQTRRLPLHRGQPRGACGRFRWDSFRRQDWENHRWDVPELLQNGYESPEEEKNCCYCNMSANKNKQEQDQARQSRSPQIRRFTRREHGRLARLLSSTLIRAAHMPHSVRRHSRQPHNAPLFSCLSALILSECGGCAIQKSRGCSLHVNIWLDKKLINQSSLIGALPTMNYQSILKMLLGVMFLNKLMSCYWSL